MSALAELDAGCNEITNLPPRMGDLARLRSLDLRSNMIVHLPIGKYFALRFFFFFFFFFAFIKYIKYIYKIYIF